MVAQLRADEDVHWLAAEVLDLTGREAHDATSVEEDQDAGIDARRCAWMPRTSGLIGCALMSKV